MKIEEITLLACVITCLVVAAGLGLAGYLCLYLMINMLLTMIGLIPSHTYVVFLQHSYLSLYYQQPNRMYYA